MDNKILVNSAIVTKEWCRFIALLLISPMIVPVILIWLISLGHIDLMSTFWKYFNKFDEDS